VEIKARNTPQFGFRAGHSNFRLCFFLNIYEDYGPNDFKL
jgi:hypothetical protein